MEEQIELLKQKLWMIYQGDAFNGKPTKTARSHGRKFQVTIQQETSRILVGNTDTHSCTLPKCMFVLIKMAF
ncbi:Protein SULFUR DEFICIENCY-INDUCED 2 [Linum perenne]